MPFLLSLLEKETKLLSKSILIKEYTKTVK